MSKLKKAINKIRRIPLTKSYRRRLTAKDFTIISQNCVGGTIYSALGLPFLSPTINVFIEGENFVKLVENLDYYLLLTPTALTDNYIDPIDKSMHYPKILVGDIEICCLHYKNCADDISAWERRRQRVNLNNVFVIANSWNLFDDKQLIERLCNTKYKTLIFVTEDCNIDNEKCLTLKGNFWKKDKRGIVRPNLTDYMPRKAIRYYESMFDFVDWFNG